MLAASDAVNLDPIFRSIIEGGGFSGLLIAGALFYLALQVRALQKSVDGVQVTISAQVFPRLEQLEVGHARLDERMSNYTAKGDRA